MFIYLMVVEIQIPDWIAPLLEPLGNVSVGNVRSIWHVKLPTLSVRKQREIEKLGSHSPSERQCPLWSTMPTSYWSLRPPTPTTKKNKPFHVYFLGDIFPNHSTRYPPTSDLLSKLWYIYAMAYYLAERMNRKLIYKIIWMTLKVVMLNDKISCFQQAA